MLTRQMALSVAQCSECNNTMIYVTVNGLPSTCPKCGVPHNVSLTQEQRIQMERLQRQQGPRVQTFRF